ncbi:MAG: SWIM zinc finger family protein, partial [Pirellulales bacterium]
VSGSELYTVRIDINRLKPAHWNDLKNECSESIDSLLDLLGGKFSDGVMQRLTHPESGLFPQPKEIKMSCSCPDWAVLCKHVAAVLYGVGARLDQEPQLLFLLRGVDHSELVSQAVSDGNLNAALSGSPDALAGEDLGAMFGIELDSTAAEMPTRAKRRGRGTTTIVSATVAKRPAKKKAGATATVIVEKSAAKKSRSGNLAMPAVRKHKAPAAKVKSAVVAEGKVAEKKKATRRPRSAR